MTSEIEYSEKQIQIAAFAKAMSHPARVLILEKLAKMNACCYSGDLVEELPFGRSALSGHLKELKLSGLIQGTVDPPYIKYCINRENWAIAKTLFKDLFAE
ncbi:MAG: ArsR family transcriptional regulator [Bacteroidales bacterium]